jgi:hypothetical protein
MAIAEDFIAKEDLYSGLQFWLFAILLSMLFTLVISLANLPRVIMREKKATEYLIGVLHFWCPRLCRASWY